jgi:hypothetical protein
MSKLILAFSGALLVSAILSGSASGARICKDGLFITAEANFIITECTLKPAQCEHGGRFKHIPAGQLPLPICFLRVVKCAARVQWATRVGGVSCVGAPVMQRDLQKAGD